MTADEFECAACRRDDHAACTGLLADGRHGCECDLYGHPDRDTEAGLL